MDRLFLKNIFNPILIKEKRNSFKRNIFFGQFYQELIFGATLFTKQFFDNFQLNKESFGQSLLKTIFQILLKTNFFLDFSKCIFLNFYK